MIAIIGAGGHASCVYECLLTAGETVAGFYDDDPRLEGKEIVDGKKVLGTPDRLEQEERIKTVFVAFGDNRQRLERCRYYSSCGYRQPRAVHPRVYISSFARVGKGSFLMGAALVNPRARVGDYVIVNTSATVGHDCVLESGVQVGPGVNLAGGSYLEEGAFVGIGARVAPNVRIGAWSVVGAGAVVLHDVPPGVSVYGTPARVKEQ